ncbi:MAG: T9SS type A sorting domain-containing protein [Cytophagaceae bacterium]|nr:T9SS type A sorting domain-containing protein [Cytophagaceae bacterium]
MLSDTKKTFSLFTLIFLLLFSLNASAHWGSKGPYGGSVKCLAVIDTFVYVGTPEGGLYRSTTKNTVSWKALNNVMTTGKINAIAALGTTIVVGSADQGIFISIDNGVTWIQKNSGLTNSNVLSLAVSGTILYAGTNGGGVFKSINSGDSWTAVNTGLSNLTIHTLASASIVLMAGTNGGGVFYSINNGTSWTAANTGLTNLTVTSLATSGSTVLVSTKGGIFSATAPTFNWSAVNTGLTNTNVQQVIISESTAYAATGAGVFTSVTSSISWTAQNTGLVTDTVNALVVFENKLIAGTLKSGLYTSDLNTIIWAEKNTSFNNLKTYALYANGNLIIAATEKGVYVSRNLAGSYTLCNKGLLDSLHVNCLAFAGTTLFAGTKKGLYQSADTGQTWQSTDIAGYVTSLLVNNNKLYLTTNSNTAVYMTPLSTNNWTLLNSGFQSNTTIISLVGHGDDVYAGTDIEGVYVLKSGAPIWSYFNTGMYNQHVSSLVIVGNKIFGATPNNGVFVSDLSAANWILSNSGLPDVHITSMATAGQYVLVGYKGGVYASSDNGTTWQSPNVLLNIPPYTNVTNIAFSNDRIFITTPYNSVYSNAKAELPGWTTTGILEQESSLNNLLQVIPNPNNGTFKLEYSALNLPVSELSIYNYSGQLMDTFIKGEENISVNYPPGIYFIRLKTKTNEVIIQKMIIQ